MTWAPPADLMPPESFEPAFKQLLILLNDSDFKAQEALDHLAFMKASIPNVGKHLNDMHIAFPYFTVSRRLGLVAYLVAHYEKHHHQNPAAGLFKTKLPPSSDFTRDELYALIEAVIDMDVDINAETAGGFFALLLATHCQDTELLTFLIRQGANVNQNDYMGISSLSQAAFDGHLEAARILLNAGADVNFQAGRGGCDAPVFSAIFKQNIPMLELLYAHGANLNIRTLKTRNTPPKGESFNPHHMGQPLLTYAAQWQIAGGNPVFAASKALEITHWLLEHGADVHALDQHGFSALHHLAKNHHLDRVQCLMAYGAPLHLQTPQGDTELHLAAQNSSNPEALPMIQFLMAQGGRLDLVNHSGETPLDVAQKAGGAEVIAYLQTCETILKEKAAFEQILGPKDPVDPIQNLNGHLEGSNHPSGDAMNFHSHSDSISPLNSNLSPADSNPDPSGSDLAPTPSGQKPSHDILKATPSPSPSSPLKPRKRSL